MAARRDTVKIVAVLCVVFSCDLALASEESRQQLNPLSFSSDESVLRLHKRHVFAQRKYNNRWKRSIVVDSNVAHIRYFGAVGSFLAAAGSSASPAVHISSRQRRAVTQVSEVSVSVEENRVGQLVSFASYVPTNVTRTYSLVSVAPVDKSIFTLSSTTGALSLTSGYSLDYENTGMRTISLVVNATNNVYKADVYVVTVRMSVTNQNEAAYFDTKPQPYLGAVTVNAASGTLIVKLLAKDPDAGAVVGYTLLSVSPATYTDRFTLSEVTTDGLPYCELRTQGNGAFSPVGQVITVTVTAKDKNDNSSLSSISTTVSVLIGLRAPQFMESVYRGYSFENNQPQQTVNTQPDGNTALKIEVKIFQEGPVAYSLLDSTGYPAHDFYVERDGNVKNSQMLDYETAASTLEQLTVRAVQTVGTTMLTSSASVSIQIVDLNDNGPEFELSRYTTTVAEDVPIDTRIMEVKATDKDQGTNGRITYSVNGTDDFYIVTEARNASYVGVIKVKRRLDYDRLQNKYYDFTILAADNGQPIARTSTSSARVAVTNVNDEAPAFTNSPGQVYIISQQLPPSSVVTQVQAFDPDGDKVRYYFTVPQVKFSLEETTGIITLNSAFSLDDYQFIINITARDDGSCCGGVTSLSNTTYIVIQVLGLNNYKPTFTNCSAYDLVSVKEESQNFTFVVQVSATDQDRGVNSLVSYFLVQPDQYLQIDAKNGTIYVAGRIDREAPNMDKYIQVTVVAWDGGTPSLEGWCAFRVLIEDINDNAPIFDKTEYVANITFDTKVGAVIQAVRASDKDSGTNAEMEYFLTSNASDMFGITLSNGFIFLNKILTPATNLYSLRVMAKDKGVPPLNSSVPVTVNVIYSSSKPPSFDKNYTGMMYRITEMAPRGTPVIENVTCNSNVNDTRVDFQLSDTHSLTFFNIRKFSNMVTIYSNGIFDYEIEQNHTVRLRCLNYGPVPLPTEIDLGVNLIDANNKQPTFVGTDPVSGRFQSSVTENEPEGQDCVTITGEDKDITPLFSKLTFEISNSDGSTNTDFAITRIDDRSAVIRSRRSFDREQQAFYYFDVVAKDGAPSAFPDVAPNPNSAVTTVAITINDVNDNPPYFEKAVYNLTVPEDWELNTAIEPYITARDPDISDDNKLSYYIDSGNDRNTFGVREGTGALFLLRRLDYETGDRFFQLIVRAFDGIHSANTRVLVNITDVNDNFPELSPPSFTIYNIVEEDTSVIGNPRFLVKFNATDADKNRPNVFQFYISGIGVDDKFQINKDTGELYLVKPLDRDLPNGRPNYIVNVQVTDELVDPKSGFGSLSVQPLDINDNNPKFTNNPLVGNVDENSEKGTSVMLVQAIDYDYKENGTVVFSILSSYNANGTTASYFAIEYSTGYMTTNVSKELLDREKDPFLITVVKLTDKSILPRSTTGTFTISLNDVNDNPPVFEKSIYKVEISESLQKGGEVVTVRATDADTGINAALTYDLVISNDRIQFNISKTENSGGRITIFKMVDYDPPNNQKFFNLTVVVTDGEYSATCYVEVTVTDSNDNAPLIKPQSITVNISEAAPVGTFVTNFSAADIVEGVNAMFQSSISRNSDPLRQFTIDPMSGVVSVRRPLDRETTAVYSLIIQAIDQGIPPQTGSATITVILEDVNDNYPNFRENYQQQVPENDPNFPRDFQTIYAMDPDLPPYSFPYGFRLAPCKDTTESCEDFGFRVNRAGDNNNGTAIISTKMQYDREKQKYYKIPIVMWDMYGSGSSASQTGTNTLTVTIADKNDNPMQEGHQDIFVFNYQGMFGPVDIGRVYVNDPDDWDLPDKTFTFLEPKWMESYFKVLTHGTIIMQRGVPSNSDNDKYTFSVQVVDNIRNETVVATVSVVINDLSDEAVRSSGAVRLQGISAEDFIKRPPLSSSTYGESAYDKFRKLLAQKLPTAVDNVLIITVMDVMVDGKPYTDVRYTTRGSPYYQSSQTDSLVVNSLEEFENTVSINIVQVPIDECVQEFFEGGCYNFLDVTGRPAMVNSNGTSFVGVEAFIRAMEGCRARDFPDPVECSGDYCYNGGTCQQDDWGVLSCQCLAGFDAPRCQQLRHSFNGNSYAVYPTLEQCEDSQTSIEFITTQSDGLILYNGPKVTPPADQPRDFISLELRGGFPVLMIDHGSGSTTLTVDGRSTSGNVVMNSLADGKWHRIDVIRTGRHVEMIVDSCESAAAKNSGGALDDHPCRATGDTPGDYTFLNVGGLLQVGGRLPSTTYPSNVVGTGFNGCVRNLRHNSKLYDLFYKEIPGVSSGHNGCSREDAICGTICGVNGMCTASLSPPKTTCVCKPGWRGSQCNTATTIRDLGNSSYLQWIMNTNFLTTSVLPYKLEMQAMFRTRHDVGVIFAVFGTTTDQKIILQMANGKLQVSYNVDNMEKVVELSLAAANNGQWHVAKVVRSLQHVTLTLDGGEGRNYNCSQGFPTGNFLMTLQDRAYVGALVDILWGTTVIEQDLIDTCVQDIRIKNLGFPITQSENVGDVRLSREQNVANGCTRDDCKGTFCPSGTFCYPLWGTHECRCNSGTYATGDTCTSNCVPNPCFNNVNCSVNNGSVNCACPSDWCGPLCQRFCVKTSTTGTSYVGVIVGVLGAIGLIVGTFFVVIHLRRGKRLQKDSGRCSNVSSNGTFRSPDLKTQHWASVSLFHFDEYLRQMHLDANKGFKLQFNELLASQKKKASRFTMRAGKKPLNLIKNRSKDVLPYDHMRVVLSSRGDKTQDYINASYVQGSDSPCSYIATQGPMSSTLSDFWKMISEHRSGVIVMLCASIEDGKKSVDQYWPDKINSPLQQGDVAVTMTSISDFPEYTLRKMIARMGGRQDLQVTQFCVRGWNESVCSLPFEKLIRIVHLVRQAARHSSGPITVHCSLGIGRTGMFIALCHLTNFVEEHDLGSDVNVYYVVQRLLGSRPNIIQTLDQYIFIHVVLRMIIAKKMRSDSGGRPGVVYQNREHPENDYDGVYSFITDENAYSSLQETFI